MKNLISKVIVGVIDILFLPYAIILWAIEYQVKRRIREERSSAKKLRERIKEMQTK